MNNRGISIIIPCFQAGRYILDTVDSIRKQPFRCEYEYIVVDDGSKDEETIRALSKIESSQDGRIIRLPNNQGAQFARNEGLRVAKYDYILSIDADDCLNTDPTILKEGTYADRAIEILENQPDVAFAHSISCMFGEFHGYTISAYPVTASSINIMHKIASFTGKKMPSKQACIMNRY